MFFSRKNKLKKKYDDVLMKQIVLYKEEYAIQKKIVESVYSTSKEMEYNFKLAESRYIWVLKEAKKRNLSMR